MKPYPCPAVFALVLLSACAWWVSGPPTTCAMKRSGPSRRRKRCQTVFPDTAATGEEQDGLCPSEP